MVLLMSKSFISENGEQFTRIVRIMRIVKLDPAICYRAIMAHDARLDSLFFLGVSSTGIYSLFKGFKPRQRYQELEKSHAGKPCGGDCRIIQDKRAYIPETNIMMDDQIEKARTTKNLTGVNSTSVNVAIKHRY